MSKRDRARHNPIFWDSNFLNDATFNFYFNQLKEICVTCFKWENLPDEIDERYLELTLFGEGRALFFKDTDADIFVAAKCAAGGTLNIYNVPTMRTPIASTVTFPTKYAENSVLIYNNIMRSPTVLPCQLFARRLTNIDRTIDVNVNAQKTPVLVTADDNERLSMENMYMQYDGNAPFIFPTKSLNPANMKVFSTAAPYHGGELTDLKQNIWNEFLTYIGIPNVSFQKRERLISDEVNRSQGGVIASRNSRLIMRQKAAREINKMFNLDIKVSFRDTDITETETFDYENGEEAATE